MKRKHRHELKQNEFLVWLDNTATWIKENQRNLMVGIAAALVVGLAMTGINLYQKNRNQEAQALLNEALELFHARITREGSAVQAAEGREFTSATERFEESLAAFQKVIGQHSGSDQGRQARYYAAVCQIGLKKHQEAEALLQEVTGGRRDLMYYLAFRTLAVAKSERGDYAGAVDAYRLMIEDPNNPLPKDQLLFNLARTNELAGDLEEAGKNYQRVLDEYPESVLRGEALQRSGAVEYRLQS